jgi:hypothetical protein
MGGSAYRKASTYKGQHGTEISHTYIHVSSGIQTHDPSVRAIKDHTRRFEIK